MAIIDTIYSKINEVFKASTQTFMMEFPGRVLDKDLYAFDTSSVYAEETKPQPVLEEEFRLTDDLFDIGNISGGPSGRKLSNVYEEALNMLVPKFDVNGDFYQDKQKIRNWLLEEVDYQDPSDATGKISKISRIDLYKKLNSEYEAAKLKWKKDKIDKLIAAEGSEKSLEDFTRQIAIEAESVDAELEGVFADLVVRGFYHEVKNCLAYLDIKTVAEQLEEAKSKLRMSSMSSFDESETVYPVQMQPDDWFAGLSTDFTSEDLLTDPDFLTDKLLLKQNSLDALNAQIASLKSAHTGDEKSLQKEIDTAQANLDNAQSQMIKNFSSATITLIQMYMNKSGKSGTKDGFNTDPLAKKSKVTLSDDDWKKITDLQNTTIENQQALTASSRALSALQAAKASAESTDTQISIQALQMQADQLRNEIASLQKVVMASPVFVITQSAFDNVLKPKLTSDLTGEAKLPDLLTAVQNIVGTSYATFDLLQADVQTVLDGVADATKKSVAIADLKVNATPSTSLLPSMPPASRWMDVIISTQASELSANSSLKTGSSQTSWGVDLLFGSAGGSSSKSWSNFDSSKVATSTNIDIGLRATKVTINRGWFRPEFFNMTPSMYRFGAQSPQLALGVPLDATASNIDAINNTFFPAYPVSFVIVKDVTIKFQATAESASTIKNVLDQSSSVGGGFLCFSASHSSTSHDSSEAFHHKVDGASVTIKIPGPQILGWYLEYLPQDQSDPSYVKLPDGALPEAPSPVPAPAFQKLQPSTALN